MLQFNSETGFTVSEVSDIRESVAQAWIDAFRETGRPELNTDPETPQGQLIDSQTAAVQQKDAELAYLAQQFNPATASGKWQDALGKIYFLSRKPAINSRATCTLTGINGTEVPAGAQVRSEYDQSIWTLESSVTVGADGTATGDFICQTAGAVEAGPETLTQIVTQVPGWDAVTNSAAAVVGQLAESQAAFEARRYQSVALNSRGTVDAVYARVAQVSGVFAVYATDNKTNVNKIVDGYTLAPHSIYVAALGGTDADIAEAIYNSVSAGCDYNGNTSHTITDPSTGAVEVVRFMRPTQLQLQARVTIQDDGRLPDDYESIIQDAVFDNFYAVDDKTVINGEHLLRVVMHTDLYASRFLPSVLNSGISQVLGVELSADGGENWTDFVHIPMHREPVLQRSSITVVVRDTEE